MEILFHGEAVLVRKFAPCCRCGQEVEVIGKLAENPIGLPWG